MMGMPHFLRYLTAASERRLVNLLHHESLDSTARHLSCSAAAIGYCAPVYSNLSKNSWHWSHVERLPMRSSPAAMRIASTQLTADKRHVCNASCRFAPVLTMMRAALQQQVPRKRHALYLGIPQVSTRGLGTDFAAAPTSAACGASHPQSVTRSRLGCIGLHNLSCVTGHHSTVAMPRSAGSAFATVNA